MQGNGRSTRVVVFELGWIVLEPDAIGSASQANESTILSICCTRAFFGRPPCGGFSTIRIFGRGVGSTASLLQLAAIVVSTGSCSPGHVISGSKNSKGEEMNP